MTPALRHSILLAVTCFVLGGIAGYWLAPGATAVAPEPAAAAPAEVMPDTLPAAQPVAQAGGFGMLLVGTTVFSDPAQSKAWLQDPETGTSHVFKTGDWMPEGFRLANIGAEDVTVERDGQRYPIRRAAADSRANVHPSEVYVLQPGESPEMGALRQMMDRTQRIIEKSREEYDAKRTAADPTYPERMAKIRADRAARAAEAAQNPEPAEAEAEDEDEDDGTPEEAPVESAPE